MNDSMLNRERFLFPTTAAQSSVDVAISRADLVALIARRRRELRDVILERDNAVTDALLRLSAAQAALQDFDRNARRAPA